MAVIDPVLSLCDYNTVREQVSAGLPDYRTINSCCQYTIRGIADDEEFKKVKAMFHLMCELNEGQRSGEEEGWMSEEEVRARFLNRSK